MSERIVQCGANNKSKINEFQILLLDLSPLTIVIKMYWMFSLFYKSMNNTRKAKRAFTMYTKTSRFTCIRRVSIWIAAGIRIQTASRTPKVTTKEKRAINKFMTLVDLATSANKLHRWIKWKRRRDQEIRQNDGISFFFQW